MSIICVFATMHYFLFFVINLVKVIKLSILQFMPYLTFEKKYICLHSSDQWCVVTADVWQRCKISLSLSSSENFSNA